MSFLDSSTALVDCILTRKGRELLARNDGTFKITKFSLSDDEIDYRLYDANNPDNPDSDILSLPVLEPISNENVAQLYRLITLPQGSLKIATLILKPTQATANYGDIVSLVVDTDNGEDPQGWIATSRDTDIAELEEKTVLPDADGVGTFSINTGLGKSGTVYFDVRGINSGALTTFQLTVNVSA